MKPRAATILRPESSAIVDLVRRWMKLKTHMEELAPVASEFRRLEGPERDARSAIGQILEVDGASLVVDGLRFTYSKGERIHFDGETFASEAIRAAAPAFRKVLEALYTAHKKPQPLHRIAVSEAVPVRLI